MESETKRMQRDYSLTFKLSIVEQIEKGELSYRQAKHRYGIQGRSTVLVWLRKHDRQDWSGGSCSRGKGGRMESKTPLLLTPEQRIKELEEQLKQAHQKTQFFEAVLDVLNSSTCDAYTIQKWQAWETAL